MFYKLLYYDSILLKLAFKLQNVASSFKKKIEDFEQSSRQAAEEDCSRMKRELEQRLVPTSEIDLERDMRRMQEEAQMKSKIEADRLEKKLRDFQSQQEREQQMIKDELRRQLLAQQMAEATQRYFHFFLSCF